MVLGRRADSDLIFGPNDAKCSGQHCELAWRDGRLWLTDLGSTNGTLVAGNRVTTTPLKSGDVVELGRGGPTVSVEWGVADADSTQAVSIVEPDVPAEGRTAIFRAMANEVKQTRSRLRVALIAASAVVVLAAVVVGFVVRRSGQQAEAAGAKADAALSGQDAARRIAEGSSNAVFMLIAVSSAGDEGFCTAFAVAPTMLATNAHCVRAMEAYEREGRAIVARMNRHPEKTLRIVGSKVHPLYTGDPRSPDVALLRLDGALRTWAPLADQNAVSALAAGQRVFTLGFPGQVMNEAMPAADLREAVISRLTDFSNTPGSAATAQLVWHTALTSKGTSGSPLFDELGQVVAVNNGGLSAKTLMVENPVTGKLETQVTYEATGLNFGVRVDLLADLLRGG